VRREISLTSGARIAVTRHARRIELRHWRARSASHRGVQTRPTDMATPPGGGHETGHARTGRETEAGVWE
jgi:hypothetical protein